MTTNLSPLFQYSVWARNIINLRENEEHAGLIHHHLQDPLPEWTEEFRGTRADCLRYIELALIDISPGGHGHRNWTFSISPPGESPIEPLEPRTVFPTH